MSVSRLIQQMALASQASTSGRLCCSSTACHSQGHTYTALGGYRKGQAVSGRSYCRENHAAGARIGSHACASHRTHQESTGAWRHISRRSHSPSAAMVCSASASAVSEVRDARSIGVHHVHFTPFHTFALRKAMDVCCSSLCMHHIV